MRRLTEWHKEHIRKAMVGNKNALKDGRYSGVPHTLTCSTCPRLMFCPYYKSGNACRFLWEEVYKWEKIAVSEKQC